MYTIGISHIFFSVHRLAIGRSYNCPSASETTPKNTHTHTHTHTYIYVYIYNGSTDIKSNKTVHTCIWNWMKIGCLAHSSCKQRKHQTCTLLPPCEGNRGWSVDSPHKGSVMLKGFHDVIMYGLCRQGFYQTSQLLLVNTFGTILSDFYFCLHTF